MITQHLFNFCSVFAQCLLSLYSIFAQFLLNVYSSVTQFLVSSYSMITQLLLSFCFVFAQFLLNFYSSFTQAFLSFYSVFTQFLLSFIFKKSSRNERNFWNCVHIVYECSLSFCAKNLVFMKFAVAAEVSLIKWRTNCQNSFITPSRENLLFPRLVNPSPGTNSAKNPSTHV